MKAKTKRGYDNKSHRQCGLSSATGVARLFHHLLARIVTGVRGMLERNPRVEPAVSCFIR